jgi:hypothetical protein
LCRSRFGKSCPRFKLITSKADWSLAMTIKDHLEEETYLPFFFDVVVYDGVESEELKRHIDTKDNTACSTAS